MTKPEFHPAPQNKIDDFISRWQGAGGTERANYQLFLTELCSLLELPQPEPASEDTAENAYVFERRVDIQSPDGSSSRGYIDLYKSGCFVLEAKQTGKDLGSQGWDKAMLRAQNQADQYVRALPSEEGRPPFIVVTDVGRSLELYAEFSRSGGTYVPFPDPGHHRIRVEDLRLPDIQERLHHLWHQPDKLDSSKYAARVTRDVSAKLAELARSLEQHDYDVERVAHFLKRCLFTMFSEDVGLLPEDSFTLLLKTQKDSPENFPYALKALWESMNSGGYSPVLNHTVRQFNGGLFQDIDPIPLNSVQIQLLIDAAKADWRFVEPAIFGTLLERALDPRERHKLGAHFTPRAYVERLVMPTMIDPLREKWSTVRIAAEAWLQQGKQDKAIAELREYHHQLCQTKVLDPACGSGNFLYVALEHMKRLEGEVVNLIRDLSAGQSSFDTEGLTVDPHQFLGLEINPRAAAIAEIVLWIGYLQWHYRIHGELNIPDPVLKDFHNIELRDALIEYESREPLLGESGEAITIWDGISYKKSPVTGDLVPDDLERCPIYTYIKPKRTEWPSADYIVGNPPFIGNKRLRLALGDGYVDALRSAYNGLVPNSADFVMYWWHIAAESVRSGDTNQFGFITTNSLRQTFNRRVVEHHLNHKSKPLSLVFVIPDHPWVDGVDGADVRIAMTVGLAGDTSGTLMKVTSESENTDGSRDITFSSQIGKLFSTLSIGANIAGTSALKANCLISNRGMIPHGEGFIVRSDQGCKLDDGALMRPYRNGRDIASRPRGVYVLDTWGLEQIQLRNQYPDTWQWLHSKVKPERDQKKDKSIRERWWLFARSRPDIREGMEGISRYLVTVQTSKHRFFTFLSADIVPDDKLIAITLDQPCWMGVLTSRLHVLWALAAGGALGVGNDPVYNKSKCFEAFPFPGLTVESALKLGDLAEKIDDHRKTRLTKHNELTLTGMYNVLEKLRSSEPLNDKEKMLHELGSISVLGELHDELDRLVFEAYGWSDLAAVLVGQPGATTHLPEKTDAQGEAEDRLLFRLVELNHQRSVEEAQGYVRWLRPEYQAPESTQTSAELVPDTCKQATAAQTQVKLTWPKTMPDQVAIVRSVLAAGPQTLIELASKFKRKPAKGVEQVLVALQVLGHAEPSGNLWYVK